MNQSIVLSQVPSQTLTIQLGTQQCTINVYQKSTGLYLDLNVAGTQILNTMLCLDRVALIRESYLGFIGQLFFVDTQGTDDPYYTGFGTRFILVYSS